ncbi:MAG: endonuclease III [Bacteroidales bacterium]|nr:endonuclease III [Bacteroidales bacterium]
MTIKQRYERTLEILKEMFPEAATELKYGTPFQLLVAVILSAQCTDKRVNMVTPKLFALYPDCQSMAAADTQDIFECIKSISYPNSKAKYLHATADKLMTEFDGQVPSDVKSLQTLPGVGRKTANVIASVVFKQAAMAVDTHVHRVSRRLGLTNNAKNVLETEKQLMQHLKDIDIATVHHRLILLGRYLCTARKCKCNECKLTSVCKNFISLQNEARKQRTD